MKTKMRMLRVVRPHKYGTRHLTAGEEYEVPVRHALALVAGKKAKFADQPFVKAKAKAPAKVEEKAVETQAPEGRDIDALRARAQALGIEVDRRWGVARLQHEIGQKRG